MKKIFKYLGIAIAVLLLIVIVSVWIFFCHYKDWFDFNNAIMKNDIVKMSSMIKKGYNINNRLYIYKDTDHLFFAVGNTGTSLQTLEFLLKHGADTNYLGKKKVPLVILATALKKPEQVKLLIKYGADLSAKSADTTLTDWAVATSQPQIIMMIPEEKISLGRASLENPAALKRIYDFYHLKQTDKRVINYLENQ
ncbi:MAG: hypothetical protein ACLUH4_06470 [Alphaproteobacteria bacterium]